MLGKFHGGLHLPGHKTLSTLKPIGETPAPARVVLPVRQHIGNAAEVLVSVGEQVKKGQKIAAAQGYVSAPVHASISGTVTAIEDRDAPHPSGLQSLCIEIESDGRDEWTEDLPEPLPNYREVPDLELRNRLRESGIVGLGGAAFPTSVKLNPGEKNPIRTVVINGAECEPYITCDDMLMREHAAEIVSGIGIVRHLLKPEQVLIGIEDNKKEAISAMRQAVRESGEEDIEVVVVPTRYPTGGEKQLIKVLTNQEVPPHGLPADIGVTCHNVGTVYAVHEAIIHGRPLIERVVTVTGNGIEHPQNLRVRIGAMFSDLTRQAGGYSDAASYLIMGGPMMGISLRHDQLPVIKATNCLLVAAESEVRPVNDASACIRCGDCVAACPVNLLPQQMYWYARSGDYDKIQEFSLFDCIECGCCSYVCPAHIPLVQYYRHAKNEIWQQEKRDRKTDIARQRHEFRQARLERQQREKAEKLAKKRAAMKANTQSDEAKKKTIQAAMERAKARKQKLAQDKAESAASPGKDASTPGGGSD